MTRESWNGDGARVPLVSRVRIRNYKSIAACDLELGPLTILVGRNGAGKSNFLDALRFVNDALTTSLDHAIRQRGGIDAVRRKSTGHPNNFAVMLDVELSHGHRATYFFEIAARKGGGFVVKREKLDIVDATSSPIGSYSVTEGEATSSFGPATPAVPDRLYLVAASGVAAFRPVYDGLSSMGFYNLNPEIMRGAQSPDSGDLLHRTGDNIASVIGRLGRDDADAKERVVAYLAAIVPGIEAVDRVSLGNKEALEFRQRVTGAKHPWRFGAESMSDGTLRALGALVAVFQLASRADPVRLVGLEEPEAALHPAAAGALMEALTEATAQTQAIITTHSADLLEEREFGPAELKIVEEREGTTHIAGIDRTSRDAIREHLYTAGELHRMGQLELDEEDLRRQVQGDLF